MLNNESKSVDKAHKIEVFSAGCKFCNNVENEVKEVINSSDTLVTYNLNDKTNSDKYYKAAEMYGINSVPSVVVDGKLLSCCVKLNNKSWFKQGKKNNPQRWTNLKQCSQCRTTDEILNPALAGFGIYDNVHNYKR